MAQACGHFAARSPRWAAIEAVTAWTGASKTAMSPSPVVLTTSPPESEIADRTMLSCCARAERIASGFCSHRRVLFSTSVKRNVSGGSEEGAPSAA
jgi:hypothetical protein